MKLGRYAFAALPLVGAIELAAHLYFAKRPPTMAQWQEARTAIEAARHPEDLLVVAPQWAEPMARQVLGDALMPLRDVARPDDSRYSSLLEISLLGQHYEPAHAWPELERRQAGKFLLRRLKNPQPQEVLYDFVDALGPDKTTVSLVEAEPKPCSWSTNASLVAGGLGGAPTFPSHRFVCPGPSHVFAGVTVIDDPKFLPRRCIMMHPPDRGFVEAVFPDVPLGKELRGHTGMRWLLERDQVGAPMVLEVFVEGQKVGEDVHDGAGGWKPWRIALSGWEGKRAAVRFRVSAQAPSMRQMCWEAESR